MKILAVTDIHGSTDKLRGMTRELREADLILIAGDMTNFGGAVEAAAVLGEFMNYNRQIRAVPGNCDTDEVRHYLSRQGLSLHFRSEEWGGYRLAGAGGALAGPGHTPTTFSDAEYERLLEGLSEKCEPEGAGGRELLMVAHQPPYKTKADRIMGVKHGGSRALRRFIEEHRPLLYLTGHIHEAVSADRLGDTLILNPGPFRSGRYAVIELSGGRVADYSLKQI